MIYHVEIAGKGGIAQYTYNLVNHLKKVRENETIAILGAKDYELKELPRNFVFIPLFNRFKTNPWRLFRFFMLKIQHRDLLHFQLSSFPGFVLLLILLNKLTHRSHIVVTAHNVVSHETTFLTKHILLTIYRLADQLIVHARQNKEELLRLFHIPEGKIAVIPHGNYLFAQALNPPKPISLKKEKFELLFFGYIRAYKGLDILLKSLKYVCEKNPNILLHIVGKPHEKFDRYAALIDALGLNNCVNLQLKYVPIEEIQYYFYRADVVVLPYKRISQSGVVFLAYAFGKPVIATNIGGLPEVIEDGKSGLLVPPEDPHALAEAILKLARQPEILKQMGIRALELSKSTYAWETIAQKTWKLYDRLLS